MQWQSHRFSARAGEAHLGSFFCGAWVPFCRKMRTQKTIGYFADYLIVWQNPMFDPFGVRRRAPLPEEPIRGVRRPSGARGGDTFCCQGSRIGAENTEQGLTPQAGSWVHLEMAHGQHSWECWNAFRRLLEREVLVGIGWVSARRVKKRKRSERIPAAASCQRQEEAVRFSGVKKFGPARRPENQFLIRPGRAYFVI